MPALNSPAEREQSFFSLSLGLRQGYFAVFSLRRNPLELRQLPNRLNSIDVEDTVSDNANKREQFLNMLRQGQEKLRQMISRLWNASPDDDYQNDPTYKAALDYYRNFKKQDGVDYSATIAYARELYDRYDKTDKSLDDKADSIIKYLGGGTALITASALLSLKIDTTMNCVLGILVLVSLIPSIVCGFRAVSLAIHVRVPQSSAYLPEVKFAVEMAHFHKEKDTTEVNLWLIYYPICEAMLIRNLKKAKQVESAHSSYRWAIMLLSIPILVLGITLICRASYLANTAG